jgi:hypothetical protein
MVLAGFTELDGVSGSTSGQCTAGEQSGQPRSHSSVALVSCLQDFQHQALCMSTFHRHHRRHHLKMQQLVAAAAAVIAAAAAAAAVIAAAAAAAAA